MRRPNLPRTHSPCPSLRSASPTLRLSGTTGLCPTSLACRGYPATGEAIPHRGIVHCCKRPRLRRRENPQQIVRPGSGTTTAKILLRRVECSSFVLRSSAVTWSECPNGVPKTRTPCSLVGNDCPPNHHWWTGSPPCLDKVLATNGGRTFTVPHLRLPLVDTDPCVVPQGRPTNLCRMARRSGAATMKMSSKKANNVSPGNDPLEIASC